MPCSRAKETKDESRIRFFSLWFRGQFESTYLRVPVTSRWSEDFLVCLLNVLHVPRDFYPVIWEWNISITLPPPPLPPAGLPLNIEQRVISCAVVGRTCTFRLWSWVYMSQMKNGECGGLLLWLYPGKLYFRVVDEVKFQNGLNVHTDNCYMQKVLAMQVLAVKVHNVMA